MDYEPQHSHSKYNMQYIIALLEQPIKPDNSPPHIAFGFDLADNHGEDKEDGKG